MKTITAPHMDSAVATSEPEENSTGSSTSENVPEPQPRRSESGRKNLKRSEDFAAALESFTTESEEAAGDDKVLKGTVLKVTPTHVVVDIGAKSEGMLPLSEVLDHEGNSRFKPGDEIDVMREKAPRKRAISISLTRRPNGSAHGTRWKPPTTRRRPSRPGY